MIRLAASALIFICCSLAGMLKAASYKSRTREIESVIELLKLLNMEMLYRRDSLSKAFERVSDAKDGWFAYVTGRCGALMNEQNPLGRSWERAVHEMSGECPLADRELDILRDLFMGLGRSDVSGQRSYMERTLMRLEACREEAAEQERKQGRMYRGLGMAAGVIIAIMLI